MSTTDRAVAALVRVLFRLVRLLGPDRAGALGAALARRFGPLVKAHRIALENIRQAFPDLPAAEHGRIAAAAWDNLGRTAAEYVHLDRLWDFDPESATVGRIEIAPEVTARFEALRQDGKPALFFAAHLANWELPAIAAARHGLPSAVLYRTPNNAAVARDIIGLRERLMGRLIPANVAAPVRMMEALDQGLHVGMLIDQRFSRGPQVPFLGRLTPSNPLLARMARRFDCPVHGARAIRLAGGRFRLELTEAIHLPRNPQGGIDVEAATAELNRIVEGWVREYPGQWLWMHRRWR
ncbi:lipid A biosynthesis lauroyl acyltransferase [Paeniroseomonas aquatica]|uniref:Lipid A biosynthesis lauroyl acyltransferase n=1 Tax=Paeniroseomonas aquatica TaxID=373043 RepID=A0ABT8ABM4_9PROT|nr:lipid A biosynthesis lauroyl acyltransferase [Paeniroseomonas aquatica]MDN3567063.1 lipid A biosynthesis lauroyl acyltransferase [Paeniroseomonas aquatica]